MTAAASGPPGTFAGTLHIHVAFDWGDEIDLTTVRKLLRTTAHPLPRRRRTPVSFEYRPLPIRFALPPIGLQLPEIDAAQAPAEATVFDFAGVSVALRVPFALDAGALARLAGELAEPREVVRAVRGAIEPLYQQLLPGIHDALFSALSEEYFVFQLLSGPSLVPAELLHGHSGWVAGLVRLEAGPLSDEEIAEALRQHISYRPDDLFVADWAAAVLLDQDCEETLQAVEFANLQLLEYRHIDNRLDDNLSATYGLTRAKVDRRGPLSWRQHGFALRVLGELKVEANELFERTGNVLKLVGDQYLARLYRMLAKRFHLPQWEASIHRKLEVLEGIYQVLSDQAATFRGEAMELIVIVLIAIEILLALWKH